MNRDILHCSDILQRIRDINGNIAAGRKAFMAEPNVQKAVLYDLTVIGEAVRRLSEEIRLQAPTVPWQQIISMRNRLVHEYGMVDLVEVWRTAVDDLPLLEASVTKLIRDLQSSEDTR